MTYIEDWIEIKDEAENLLSKNEMEKKLLPVEHNNNCFDL